MCNKVGYVSKSAALEDARAIRRNQRHFNRRTNGKGRKFNAYRCRFCEFWHLTTQKPKRK